MHHLRFRQIHLDFHTSPHIPGIGESFDKAHWQKTLREAAVDSITCFATCHHGWSYYQTKLGKMHPHLKFDLLRAQYDACKEININVPIYLTAGVNNLYAYEHPEWRPVNSEGRYTGWAPSNLKPGFHQMCFNSPYLDYLCSVISEVATLYPGCDGIFLDIISQPQCCCRWCLDGMHAKGYNPLEENDRKRFAKEVLLEYYRRTTAAARVNDPEMPIFHNSGHIDVGDTAKLEYFSHLELESLPTGGWGYDHFPMSAKYTINLPHDFLGMTGKFHSTWGEFGGYKHPNALRYECAAMLAVGAKCSIGDQLHPGARLDASTYGIIGAAYREVAAKEEWCDKVIPRSDVAILSSVSVNGTREYEAADVGAGRVLLEGHYLFSVIDTKMDFAQYKVLILPDDIAVGPELKGKLDAYLAAGGKLLLTGESGLDREKGGFLWDIGAEYAGQSEFSPDYIVPVQDLAPDFVSTPLVMYMPSQRIKVKDGKSLGDVYDPYFNRTYAHFSSHQHTPNRPEKSGYACGVQKGNILYLAHPVFKIYRGYGAVAYRQYVTRALDLLLGEEKTLACDLPSTGRVHLMRQPEHNREVLHLLYASTSTRGGQVALSGGTVSATRDFEIIEDLLPLAGAKVSIKTGKTPKKITLEPEGRELPFKVEDGVLKLDVPAFTCHQMVVMEY